MEKSAKAKKSQMLGSRNFSNSKKNCFWEEWKRNNPSVRSNRAASKGNPQFVTRYSTVDEFWSDGNKNYRGNMLPHVELDDGTRNDNGNQLWDYANCRFVNG